MCLNDEDIPIKFIKLLKNKKLSSNLIKIAAFDEMMFLGYS